jgi:pilus assembly protein CpaC
MLFNHFRRATLGAAAAVALAAGIAASSSSPAVAQNPSSGYRPTREVQLSVGEGELIALPRDVANVWTSNPDVADVQVNNPRQIGLFGKANGEATIIATSANGSIVYGAHVTVAQNISSISEMLHAAMPDSDITVTPVGQIAVLNGTVASPEDSAQAEMLVRALLNPGVDPNSTAALRIVPVNRLRTATPQQVMLKVTIAEVSRSVLRDVNVNLQALDTTGGTGIFFSQGRDFIDDDGNLIAANQGSTGVIRLLDVLGLNINAAADLRENNGLVTILAEPTLTSLSGETASFLDGGEFPIPIAQSLGTTTIEYRQFGVGLAFTPFVLENGRISMRVRPEVSELSSAGSIEFNGFEVPSLTVRRTETTVELGSGQSLVIGGLMRNVGNNSVDRTPFLGSLPIIGALFRSNSFQRDETELVIVVTPYLVQPVNANQIALPTDGFRTANDGQRLLVGQEHDSRNGEPRPVPTSAAPRTVAPGVDTIGSAAPVTPGQPTVHPTEVAAALPAPQPGSARPGFDF